MESQYSQFFKRLCNNRPPYAWQEKIGADAEIRNRLISIPTGFGKTHGVAMSWLYQRVMLKNATWPRRLVWCLPMRTLVEQTAETLRKVTKDMGISVHMLMGGSDTEAYHLEPEKDTIFVGTQDMLISRALNRGYGVARARWPMEFALLNNDCLWILDEVQLMDVSLITSVQMQQFRQDDASKTFRPSYSWWMSATLQPEWLETPETAQLLADLKRDVMTLQENDYNVPLWANTQKPVSLEPAKDDAQLCEFVKSRVQEGQTLLVIVNTVKRAIALYDKLISKKIRADQIRLIHSRFRMHERRNWTSVLLNRQSKDSPQIIIATQVVEAGVDISASTLVTELAPWTSLVQRFGRCARYGERGNIHVIDIDTSKAANALPYQPDTLDVARNFLKHLTDVALKPLCELEKGLTAEERANLYPHSPAQLLLRHDLEALFDTTADLTGSDLDISRFIRNGQERDCSVFWADIDKGGPSNDELPSRDELCSVPVYELTAFLKKQKDIPDAAFTWNYLENRWEKYRLPLVAGRIIMLNTKVGGYSELKGFTGNSRDNVGPVPKDSGILSPDIRTDLAQDAEDLSQTKTYQSIAEHDAKTVAWGEYLCQSLSLPNTQSDMVKLALALHDIGKAHPQFQSMIKDELPETACKPLAKAPQDKWQPPKGQLWIRHELASALALMDVLAKTDSMHPSLLGELGEYIDAGIIKPMQADQCPSELGKRLSKLSKGEFNLLIYLVAAHHGKVRAALHSTPEDQKHVRECNAYNEMPIRGIYEGDVLPETDIIMPDHSEIKLPQTELHLDVANMGLSSRYGRSWSERIQELLSVFGPFGLAWLETIVRVADIQASIGNPIPRA